MMRALPQMTVRVLHRRALRAGRLAGLAFSLVLLSIAQSASGGDAAAVMAIRLGIHTDSTRFVAELTRPISYTIFTLADPYRLVIDLPRVDWKLAAPEPAERGLITDVRYGNYRQDRGRIILDLSGPAKVKAVSLLEPRDGHGPRIVLDLAAIDRQAFLATAGWPETENKAAVLASLRPNGSANASAQTDGAAKPVVVIDPGHGGVDPGAQGANGTLEKDVTLAFAKALQAILDEDGRYEVVLTRDDDVALPLRSRVERARVAGASLFISLHADALPKQPDVHGLSVYTISAKATDAEAAALAQKENRADIIAGVDLSGEPDDVTQILIDLAQRQTMSESMAFADDLMQVFTGRASLIKNAHRSAGFRVLKAPDVPSVLIELGYLSNESDLEDLASESWRKSMAEALRGAIDRHFAALDQRFAEQRLTP